jgi:serine/threonine protein kinase
MSTNQLVAIKEDTRSKPSAEPQIHAQLGKHEHIVEFLGSFSDKRRSFIAMEYCRFGTMKQMVDEHGTLPLRSGKNLCF